MPRTIPSALAALLLLACGGAPDTTPDPTRDAGRPPSDAGAPTIHDGGSSPSADGAAPRDAGGGDASAPSGAGCGVAPGANDRRWTLTHDGRERAFFVHLPAGYDPSDRTPVVLGLHGRNSDPQQQMLVSAMNQKADAEGFIAVHPEGVGATWNGGLCCGEAMSEDVDDVGFVRALLDRLAAELCVDEDRVFATGLSNGGFMSHRLACELADRIAAVAPVAGPNGTLPCEPSRPVPVLHFHGTDDRIVPYDGFAGQLAVRPTMTDWAERNGCGSTSRVYLERGDVTCEEWTGCDAGATVRLCTIEGGGHQWPGGTSIPFLGNNTNDISATDAMWDFFTAHPR